MEGRTLLALFLCCCLADVDAERFRRTVAGPASDSKPGFEIITTLPEPKQGFFLNRQFQNNNERLENDVQPNENTGGVRQVVDSQGRHWVVAELPKPEPGYYYNRHTQNKKANLPSPGHSNNANQVVFKKTPDSVRKEVVFPETEEEQAPQAVADGKPQQKVRVNPSALFPSLSGLNQNLKRPVVVVLQPQIPLVRNQQAQIPAITQTASNQQRAEADPVQVERGNVNKHTQKTVTVIGQAPEVTPARQNTEVQGSGFSCEGKPFGYYGDLESGCQKYHVCNPIAFSGSYVRHYKYSFTCGAGLRFDPGKKVCVPTTTASVCQ